MVSWLVVYGLRMRLTIMEGSMWWTKVVHLMVDGRQTERGRDQGQGIASKDLPL
jgi:hypothetical protein